MENMNVEKIAIIGGDARGLIAAARFKGLGKEVRLYGFKENTHAGNVMYAVDSLCCSSSDARPHELIHNIADGSVSDCGITCVSAAEAIDGCDAVILPLPSTKDGVFVSTPLAGENVLTLSAVYSYMTENKVKLLCGGKIPSVFSEKCRKNGIKVFDYYESEAFSIANAVPTAEGAIEIAMKELPITLNGGAALVIGYGRIGKVLSKLLCSLGADVTVSARNTADLAWIEANGYRAFETGRLSALFEKTRFDMIFNTVPYKVLGKNELEAIPRGTLIVDLASKPGGVDTDAAEKLTHNIIWALSLPGKVAPVTSGHIIADTILGYIEKCADGGFVC